MLLNSSSSHFIFSYCSQYFSLTCFAPRAINLHLFLKLSPRRCCDSPQVGDHAWGGCSINLSLQTRFYSFPKDNPCQYPKVKWQLEAGAPQPVLVLMMKWWLGEQTHFPLQSSCRTGCNSTSAPARMLPSSLTQPLSPSCLRSFPQVHIKCSVFKLKHQLELEVNPPLQRIQSNPQK